ncbi:MAG TPA: OmpA family protein [Saprospiraceae bacterium]|nr:OmpA family protein [Saprospiraceae bacterium]
MKSWIIPVVLFIPYAFFGARYYTCHVKNACGVAAEEVVTTPEEQQVNSPITFNWSSDEPILKDEESMLQSIAKDLKDGQVVQITGQYFSDENNETAYENLGQARAERVKELLSEQMEPQNIRTASDLVDGTEQDHQGPFESVVFSVVDVDVNKAEVLKLKDKVVILFPDGSTTKEPNEVIDNYLDQLAEELKNSNRTVELIGHTDMMGDSKSNYKLGLRRAKNIRDYLRKKGVSRKAIVTKSMGEKDPVATNDTPEGRHQNRRVEIIVK